MPHLEDRVRRLEDRAELQDLVVTYFRATDDNDYATLAACFTPNAEFSASGFSGSNDGREGIVEFLKLARSRMKQTIHTPNFIQLEFHGNDGATGLIGAHLELGMAETTVFGAVRYADEYRRDDGRWRIRRREMRVIHVGPWADVESSLTSERNVRWPGAIPQSSDFSRK